MATIAAFGVVAGGGAYAASKIDTPDIANQAITAKKLASKAVTRSKLGSDAVTSEKIDDGAVGPRDLSQTFPVALAGADVSGDTVFGWFNRINDGEPTVAHVGTGVYQLSIPGMESGFSDRELLGSATLLGVQPGQITTTLLNNSAGDDLHPEVYTFDGSGNPADR